MAYVLALVSAALFGAADFIGGLAARRAATIAVVLVSQAAGLLLLAVLLPLLPATAPSHRDLVWGAAAGLAGGVGVALLYRALAVGTMALVAPVTAVCAVVIPVLAGLLLGDRLSGLTLFGIGLALVSIVLVSQQGRTEGAHDEAVPRGNPRTAMWLALLSGVAIGLFFLALARTNTGAGLWPLVAARGTSVLLFAVLAVGGGHSIKLPRPVARWAVMGGALDMTANALYLLAARQGPLSVIVTLASLYPASTVILARIVLGERLSRPQHVGIVCAMAAVVMIVGSS